MATVLDETALLARHGSVTSAIEGTTAAVWLAAVALAPVWFGSNTPAVWAAHAVSFGIVLAAYALAGIARPHPLPVPITQLKLPLVALAVVLGWAAIQTIQGVPLFLQNRLWSEAATVLGNPVAGAISVYPAAGRTALLWASTAAAVFFLAVQLGRDPVRARTAVYVIAVGAGVIAAYGLAEYFDGNALVLWQPKHAYLNALTATFINKNNYAAFAGMGLVCTFGLLLDRLPRNPPFRPRRTRGGLIVRGLSVLTLGAVFAANCAALLLAGSRAGAAVTILGMAVVLMLWLARLPAWRRPLFVAFGLTALGILVLASSSSELLVSRLPNLDQDLGTRLAVDARMIAAIKAEPWTGYGLGAFEQAFTIFRDPSLSAHGRWEYGHNDWLEALMTLGIPAGLAVWLIFGWIGVRCVIGAMTRARDAIYPAIGAGVCALAFAHTLVDFTMQIQGFALPFLAIAGTGVAQSWSSRGFAGSAGQSDSAASTTIR